MKNINKKENDSTRLYFITPFVQWGNKKPKENAPDYKFDSIIIKNRFHFGGDAPLMFWGLPAEFYINNDLFDLKKDRFVLEINNDE